MKDDNKTKKQLIDELAELRKKLSEPEATGGTSMPAGKDLKAQSARNELILRTTHDGFWVVGLDGNLIEVNDSYCRMVGYSREELLSMNVADLEANEDPEEVKSHIEKILREGEDRFESRHRRKDGNLIDLQANVKLAESGGESFLFTFLKDITESKRAYEELRLKGEIITNMAEGTHLVRVSDGIIIYANPRFEEMFGYGTGELNGKHVSVLNNSSDKANDKLVDEVFESLRKDNAWSGEVHNVKKDGTPFWSHVTVSTIEHPEHAEVAVTVQTDITERKLAEEELNRSRQKNQLHVQRNPLAVIEWNPDFEVAQWNPAAEEMFGYSREEALGRHAEFIIHKNAKKHVGKVWQGLLDQKNGERSTNENITKDGRTILCEWYNTPLVTQSGEVMGVASLVQDITEFKRAEEELLLHSEIINRMTEGVYLVRMDGIIVYTNPKFEQMFGYEPGEMIGKHASIVNYPTEKKSEETAREILEILDKEGVWLGEIQNVRKDGTPFWSYASVVVFDHSKHGKVLVAVHNDITERKRAEEKLKTSEERFRSVFENSASGMVLVNTDGRFMRVNPALCKTVGYSEKELIGKMFNDITHPDDLDIGIGYLKSILAGEIDTACFEKRYINKAGDTLWVSIVTTLLRDVNSEPLYIISQINNISERKRAEESLRKAKDELEARVEERTKELSAEIAERKLAEAELRHLSSRYEAILKAVPDIIIEVDANKVYRWANQAGYEFFGEGVIGREASYYFEGEQETYSVVQPLFNGEEDVIYLESWQRRKDNEMRLLAWWCRALKDENGHVAGALSTARDITEQKRAEEALSDSESLFKQLVETTSAIVWEVDMATSKFNYVSPQALHITGYAPEEWIDFDFWASLIHPDDRKPSVDFCQMKTAKSEDHEFEYRLITKDGRVIWLRDIVNVIAGEEGPQCLRGFMIDITEQKEAEKNRLKAQKLESVGVLAGGIAHDFNNIITGILGNISLAKIYSSPEGKAFGRLVEAENAVEHATRLAQQLLTFSKGGKPIKEAAYIRNLIKDSVSFSLSGSNIRCEYSIPEDLWPVDMDAGQMNQVISNLAINARYAMPEGGLLNVDAEDITTGTDKEDAMGGLLKEGRYIRISVKDNGTGIEKEHLDKIFDPYFSTKEEGSGLGLATSYSIIKKHDGHITVESQPGVGTTFHIYLRASEELPVDKGRGELTTSLKERKQKGMKVLVMDDEEIIRDVSGEMLTSLGYEVNFATDGNEAIELYRKAKESGEPFDVVIMDLTIPGGMGGKEAIKKLLELDPGAKVIVSSGYSNDPVMSGYKEYGFRGVIAKPYKLVELSAKVHKVIAGED